MAVLDTNVIIEIARGNKELLDSVLSADSYFLITSITRFEIMIGAPKLVELDLISSLDCLPFDEKSADISANIYKELKKSGREMSLRDLFIGAICITNRHGLITLDSDFKILEDFGLELTLID
jgi:hypothetical protein